MDRLVIDDLELSGQRVLLRVDFNVPLANGVVVDDTRIRAALPTIRKILESGGRAVLASHLGRPKGQVKAEFSLAPVAKHLSTLLAKSVQFLPDCVGPEIEGKVAALKNGEVCLLENTRFHKSETANDDEFSKQLARLADVYINDAFGAAHRAHASTVGVTKHIKQSAAGYLLRSEVEQLTRLIETPEKPFVAILGGAKVPDKLKVIHNLVTKVSSVLIGGGMAYTFLRAKEIEVGDSLLDQESISMAYNAMVVAQNPHPLKRLEFLLPFDHTIASSANENTFSTSRGQSIEKGWKGVDIGPKTIEAYGQRILKAKTIFWNGPMGIFEKDNFAKGTIELARLVASATAAGAFSVVGGGDSIAAIEKAGVKDKISHVSTGGGASLEFLAGIDLPGINALSKAAKKKE
jgi:phosphoglycerate kinase